MRRACRPVRRATGVTLLLPSGTLVRFWPDFVTRTVKNYVYVTIILFVFVCALLANLPLVPDYV